jgi:hypothetical protein
MPHPLFISVKRSLDKTWTALFFTDAIGIIKD